jgi:hypothetical protein
VKYILLVCTLFLSLIITFDLFLKEPPVWPDEGGLAQYAIQVAKDPLNYIQTYPSIYILALSGWFHIFGISIVNQRILSLIAGILTGVILYLILKHNFIKHRFSTILFFLILLTDFTFLQATRVGRPEMLTLIFGMSSLYFLFEFSRTDYKKAIFLLLSIFSSAIAFLLHLNAFIFLLIIAIITLLNIKKIYQNNKKFLIFLTIIIIPTIFWLATRLSLFIGTVFLRIKIGNAQGAWLTTVFDSKPLELKLIYLSYIFTTILFFIYFIMKPKKELLIVFVSLILSWIVFIFNKDFWYAVYPLLFIVIALVVLFDKSLESWLENKSTLNKFFLFSTLIISAVLFLSNLKFQGEILLLEGGDKYSYEKYSMDIQKYIPDNKVVFSSSIPDTFFVFAERKNNTFIRFPQSFILKVTYMYDLNRSDYIIFNGSYGDNYYGDIVLRYIEKNKLNIVQIGEPSQYQAYIVELKPKDQRIEP